jgi:predicted nucleotidyltransferase
MPLPGLNHDGELPAGIHVATIDEVTLRFGSGSLQRQAATARLRRIYRVAQATGHLDRLILFGSYVTAKTNPNDVDVLLVMRDDFEVRACETRKLFDHVQATETFGASVFWIRPSLVLLETLEDFIAYWQTTRERTRRGIVEVKP